MPCGGVSTGIVCYEEGYAVWFSIVEAKNKPKLTKAFLVTTFPLISPGK